MMTDSDPHYQEAAPTREALDAMKGPLLVNFGNDWCGHCRAAAPLIAEALDQFPATTHLAIADGRGRRLGRSFAVKLWPTLVFMRDGIELARLVRPRELGPINDALAKIAIQTGDSHD